MEALYLFHVGMECGQLCGERPDQFHSTLECYQNLCLHNSTIYSTLNLCIMCRPRFGWVWLSQVGVS